MLRQILENELGHAVTEDELEQVLAIAEEDIKANKVYYHQFVYTHYLKYILYEAYKLLSVYRNYRSHITV